MNQISTLSTVSTLSAAVRYLASSSRPAYSYSYSYSYSYRHCLFFPA